MFTYSIPSVSNSVDPGSRHCYRVSAIDLFDKESELSNEACATTPQDLQDPTVPTNLNAKYLSDSTGKYINLTWTGSSDDGGISYYRVYRNGVHITDQNSPYADHALEIETEYCYYLVAVDVAGKESGPSDPVCAASSWISNTVVTRIHSYPQAVSMAIDSLDYVHIAFKTREYNLSDGTWSYFLKYTKSNTGQWGKYSASIVEEGTNSRPISLAVDSSQIIHIGHERVGRPRYSTNASGGWHNEDIAADSFQIHTVSLDTDSTNQVHLCYSDFYQIKYTTNISGSWVTQGVGPLLASWGQFSCDISLDAADDVHISYTDPSNDQLMYATNESGAWTTQVIDATGIAAGSSIAIDSAGNIHISYHDHHADKNLLYASNSTGSWASQILDSVGDVGGGSAIAIDLAGNIHISYSDATNKSLKYASNAYGTWRVLSINGPGFFAGSIAVDSTNKVHIIGRDSLSIRHSTNRDYQ
jgi:hypothetical protein